MKCPATEIQAEHIAALQGMSSAEARASYIDKVRNTEGNFYADWLSDEYAKWFWEEKRRQAGTGLQPQRREDP